MIKQLVLLTLMLVIFSSFFWKSVSKESKIVSKIVHDVSGKYEKKYGLKFAGISLSAPGGIYRDIGVSFDYKGLLSKDKARKILIESATDLIEKINANVALRPYLKNYPFTGDNVTVNIFLNLPNGKEIYYPDMTVVSFYGNKVRYKYDDLETVRIAGYYLVETETYEEAREIVESQSK